MRKSTGAVLTLAAAVTAAVLPATAADAASTTLYVGSTNCSNSGSGSSTTPFCTIWGLDP